MKLSSINLNTLSFEQDLVGLYKKINDTKTNYPADKSIVDIFNEVVLKYPHKAALRFNDELISYRQLDERSNQVANWLLSVGVKPESGVAIYFERSVEMIISILGILKAGAAYLPLNIDYPTERNRHMLTEAKAGVLISETKHIRDINQLQWLCPQLQSVLCIDSENYYRELEGANPLMKKELWEYVGETAEDDIAGGGWKNSYNAEKFTREMMDEYAANAYLKLKPYLNKSKKVLEIGCASGITMYKVAPEVKSYYGTDLSDSIIKYNQNKCAVEEIDNIQLKCLGADEIDQLNEKFDIVIINSVIQAFNGLNYLRRIIAKACDALNDNGIIFIGDVMDLATRDNLIKSVHEYKKRNPQANSKLDFSNELFVSKDFFDDCRVEFPHINTVTSTPKIFTISNELTDFRYDVILCLDKNKISEQFIKNKYQFDLSILKTFSNKPVNIKVGPNQLSNIMFTSGSTGMPKGTLIEHHSILRLVINSNFLDVKPTDNWLQTAEISFDPSCMEVFGALLNGATLCLIAKDVLLDSDALHHYMIKCNITILQLVSALFHRLSEHNVQLFTNVRRLVIGGEVLSPRHIKNVKNACPHLTIINAYGPTENCVVSTAFEIDGEYEAIPIGKPISNSGIYIFNDDLQLQPIGIAGELYLSGDGLARGYLGAKQTDIDKFIYNPQNVEERIYRTGDIVRLRPDLNLEFIGRKDSQMKINGHRVELSEIEAALKNVLDVKQVLLTTKGKNKELCAYVTSENTIDSEAIKQLMAVTLPEHMIPQYIVRLDEFPMTPNGKINTNALPEPDYSVIQTEVLFNEPINETERKLLEIFKEVLGKEQIRTDQDFFQIGGHSLLATQVLSRINKAFNISIKLKSIFNYPTVKELANEISKAGEIIFEGILPVAKQTHYDLSHAQQRLWVLNHMPEYSSAYNMIDVHKFKGELDISVLEKSFKALIERHEILRTVFEVVDGNPKQRIIDFADFNFSIAYEDLRLINENETQAVNIVNEEAARAFDLENGPLLRAKILHIGHNDYVFILTMHHIAGDAWSLLILISELLNFYNTYKKGRQLSLTSLKIQYKDYAEWQNKLLNSTLNQKLKQYWHKQFVNALPVLNLPLDYQRTATKNTLAEKVFFSLPEKISVGLNSLNKQENVTLFMSFTAIINLLLYKYTNQTDIILGTPIAGRNHRDLENQIGIYINTLALRSNINTEKGYDHFLKSVKEITLDAFEHQMYPFDVLVDDLNIKREISRSPLFDVGFTWQNVDVPENRNQPDSLEEIKVESFNYNFQNVKTDLWIHGAEVDGQISFSISYNLSLFKRDTIDKMIIDFINITEKVIQAPSKALGEVVNELIQIEKKQMADNFNKVKENRFEKFLNVQKKAINVDRPLITQSFLNDGNTYPVFIKPNMEGLILSKWIKNNRGQIQQLLNKNGAILFRDFDISNMQSFQEVVSSLSEDQMAYIDQSSPRTLLSDKTYTSTDHPEDQVINMHNELSYSHDWPMQIMFYCLKNAETNGETPIADSRKVFGLLREETRRKFADKGILYVRNLVKGFGLSWQDVYQTNDKSVVEKYCIDKGINFEWLEPDNLRISWTRPAIRIHPVTNEEIWFNHGFFFNASNLDESVHEAIGNKMMLPFNTFYGDGTEIEPEVIEEIREAYNQTKVSFKWKQGDVLLLDNMLMAHGRNSYTGDRKILVAMNNPFSQIETESPINN